MPVRKYRSVAEMNQPVWYEPGSPELMRAIRRIWSFAEQSGRRRFPPGVYKHRSIEDLNEQTRKWQE